MNAALLTALRPLRTYLAQMPRDNVDDDLAVDETIAYIAMLLAEEIDGTDSHCALRNMASEITGTVRITRERLADATPDLLREQAA